jgi:hypothetical protein
MRMFRAIALVVVLVLPLVAGAHEGHKGKVLGTVSAVDSKELAVKTRDGKTVRLVVDDKTAVWRGEKKVSPAEIVAGERIVVTVGSRGDAHVAERIDLGKRPN